MGDHDGWMWFGGGYMWLLWILIIAVLVVLIKSLTDSGTKKEQLPTEESPLSILKERYARGEIDDDEFERRKNELEQ